MLQPDRLDYYFSLTHELPEVEFKGPGKGRDNPLFGRIVRAAMAMANRRGGGTVIIGVAEVSVENSKKLSFDGLTPEQLATWNYDDIASGFNSYTGSPIEFERLAYEHDGKTFLILDIHEFAAVPVMCVKEYRDRSNQRMPESQCPVILRPGIFYVRTLNKPESKEMLTGEEVRILFNIANDKAVQSFAILTGQVDINLTPELDDKELFALQLRDWKGPILDNIRLRGYWDIHIRPVTFERERLSLTQSFQLFSDISWDYLYWRFPYCLQPYVGPYWIGLERRDRYLLQAWRFFQSGFFAAEVGLRDDWRARRVHSKSGSNPSERLSISDVILRLTNIFAFASQLAMTDIYRGEQFVVTELTLRNLQKRRLYKLEANDEKALYGRNTWAEHISYAVTLAKEDIIAHPQELALEAAQYIFERFGWYPSDQVLASMQSDINIHS